MDPRDFKDATALLPPRVRTRRFWVITISTAIFLSIIYAPYIFGSRSADTIHFEAFKASLGGTDSPPLAGPAGAVQPGLQVPAQQVAGGILLPTKNDAPPGDDIDEGPGVDMYGRRTPHYRKLYSMTSPEKKYWLVWLGGEAGYNPNLLPHPTEPDRWVVLAQHERSDEMTAEHQELVCTAGFFMDKLVCSETPTVMQVTDSIVGNCTDGNAWINLVVGPRDARMFYGPDAPFVMYGSQSAHACLGIWMHDGRMLLPPFQAASQQADIAYFKEATELQRPEPWHAFEKNFFVFWDDKGGVYVHNDLWPRRSYAALGPVGNVGDDLAPQTVEADARCMNAFMPPVEHYEYASEGIHQATNSLSITMCARADPTCTPTDSNTFIMTVFHWKAWREFHGIYEPYIMLFKRTSPFPIHAIGQRPYWVYGRGPFTAESGSPKYRGHEDQIPKGHTEQIFFTSMSWKNKGQTYHGYVDDPLFLSFGIEDGKAGVIDVHAGDLLQDLAECSKAPADGKRPQEQQSAQQGQPVPAAAPPAQAPPAALPAQGLPAQAPPAQAPPAQAPPAAAAPVPPPAAAAPAPVR
ncbi:hypothetical protein CBER1_00153 [Cercospora berteroae]|uniref:EH domain-containing protein n=1 Tax=Cercospora berteroae TaxID=357750 RepID=A0A2S6CDM2_9PEZI|nr:hypothetical protein CBER1_00153 [Cercospora berteroae]